MIAGNQQVRCMICGHSYLREKRRHHCDHCFADGRYLREARPTSVDGLGAPPPRP